MRQMYEWRHLWTPPFHRASKTTNLLVLFLYIILYPHSLHLMGSLDFISFSVWHSPQIYIIGCCFGGWTSFWASIVSASTAGRSVPSLSTQKHLPAPLAFLTGAFPIASWWFSWSFFCFFSLRFIYLIFSVWEYFACIYICSLAHTHTWCFWYPEKGI